MVNQDRDQRKATSRVSTWPSGDTARAGDAAHLGAGFWIDLVSTISAWVRAEAGPGRVLPWVPVAFGTGIALYFAAEREPMASVTAATAAALCFAAFLARSHSIFPIVVMLAALAAGFAHRAWRAGAADVCGDDEGLCRNPRGARTH